MILIVFAQVSEAQATIQRLNASAIEGITKTVWADGEVPSCYQFAYRQRRGQIVISNVGIHSAQMTVSQYAPTYDEVWNLGLAGSLQENQKITDLVPIQTVGKYIPLKKEALDPRSQECVDFTLPHLTLEDQGRNLISSDFPIHSVDHRTHIASSWDLVDMEGYGIAYACMHLGKKCRMWKIISDFASEGGRELIRKHKATLSEMIADKIIQEL